MSFQVATTSPAVWYSNVYGHHRLTLFSDGRLMVYDANMAVKWSSGQQGQTQYLKVKDDGTMVVYAQDGHVIWSTVQY